MFSFSTIRKELEVSDPVLVKFKEVGEFSITAAEFAEKVAPAYGCQAEAAQLLKVIGASAPVFRFKARQQGSEVPVCLAPSAFYLPEGESGRVAIVDLDLAVIPSKITKHRIGPRGYVVAKVGTAEIEFPLAISDEFRADLISARNDEIEVPDFTEAEGEPPLKIASFFEEGLELATVKAIPQRDLPPWAEEVPHLSDLEVVEILEPSRQFGSPRISVRLENGSQIVGLIATAPIVRALCPDGELTKAAIGQLFQIVAVEERRRRDGEVVTNENGTVQKTVIVRNTTKKISFSL
jgi:hypothetical protein